MKVAIVKAKDMFDPEANPTLCISPLRYTGGCLECLKYPLMRENYDLDKVLKKVLCNPIITENMLKLHKEKEDLKKEWRALKAKIDRIDSKLGLKT